MVKLTRIPKWLHPELKQFRQILEADFIIIFLYDNEEKEISTNVIRINLPNDETLHYDVINHEFIEIDHTFVISVYYCDAIMSLSELCESLCNLWSDIRIIKSSADVYYIANILYYFLDSPLDIIRIICSYLYNYAITNAYDGEIIYSSYKILEENEYCTFPFYKIIEDNKHEIKLCEL